MNIDKSHIQLEYFLVSALPPNKCLEQWNHDRLIRNSQQYVILFEDHLVVINCQLICNFIVFKLIIC